MSISDALHFMHALQRVRETTPASDKPAELDRMFDKKKPGVRRSR